MASLNVTQSTDYRNDTLVDIDAIAFELDLNALEVTAEFNASQLGGGQIAETATITGSNGQDDRINFHLATLTSLDLSQLQFSNWEPYDFDGSLTGDLITVFGSANADTITGSSRSDQILGLEGDNVLDGGLGRDHVTAGSGNDILKSLAGNTIEHEFQGGGGTDTLVIDRSSSTTALILNDEFSGNHFDDVGGGWNFYSIEKIDVTGGSGNDQFTGGAGDDILRGGSGDDTIYTTGGVDTLDGGAGADDLLIADRSSATEDITFSNADPSVLQTIDDGTTFVNFERLDFTSGTGNDTLVGGALVDQLHGNGGDDDIDGGLGADSVSGGSDDDVLRSGLGNDLETSFDGGDGIDTAVIDRSTATSGIYATLSYIHEANGNEWGMGSIEKLQVTGGSGNDELLGGSDSDVLIGGDGNDIINSGTGGMDTLDGGAGLDDLLIADRSSATEDITFSNADPSVLQTIDGGTTFVNFERLDFTSGSGNDTLVGGALVDQLHGNDGTDDIDGGLGADSISGGNDDDVLRSGLGNDLENNFDGGDGIDTAVIDRSTATSGIIASLSYIQEANGSAWNMGGIERLQVTGGSGSDDLTGGSDDDVLTGGGGNDTINSGAGGADILDGGAGVDDLLIADRSSATENISFTLANPTVVQTIDSGATFVNFERTQFTAGSGNDTLVGGALDDILFGSAGTDDLDGGLGVDDLTGGDDNDVLRSALGNTAELQFIGGDGTDTAIIDRSSATVGIYVTTNTVQEEDGNSWGMGGIERLQVNGGSGADELVGGEDNDILNGGGGNDVIHSGTGGTDVLDGGTGVSDQLFVDRSTSVNALSFSLASPATLQTFDGSTAVNFEQVDFIAGSGADILVGGALSDNFTGNGGADDLDGGLGEDYLDGGSENDTLRSGLGNTAEQQFNGGDGIDTAIIDRSTATVDLYFDNGFLQDIDSNWGMGDVERYNLSTGSGSDDLTGGAGNDNLNSGGGDDTVSTSGGVDVLDGGAGTNDLLVANRSAATVAINFSLANPAAIQTIDGGTTIVNFERVDFTSGSGADVLVGGALDDTLHGSGGADDLDGGLGIDYLDGGADNDILRSGLGNTEEQGVNGGSGIDTLVIDRSNATIGLHFENGEMAFDITGGWSSANVEKYQVTLGSGNDQLTGGANSGILNGGGGDDTINGIGGTDILNGGAGSADYLIYDRSSLATAYTFAVASLAGTHVFDNTGTSASSFERIHLTTGNGADVLTGGVLDDTFVSGGGADTLDGGLGVDTLDAGASDDTLISGAGNTFEGYYEGNAGTDKAVINRSTATIGVNINIYEVDDVGGSWSMGGVEVLEATGGSGNDELVGGNLRDILNGGGGDDYIYSFAGNDAIDGGAGTGDLLEIDRTTSVANISVSVAALGTGYTFDNGATAIGFERLIIDSGSGNDTLTGGALDDTLFGNNGNDILNGGTGRDKLSGGEGDDSITSLDTDIFLHGGSGVDFLTLNRSALTSNIVLDLTAVTTTFLSDSTEVSGFERLTAVAGSGNDVIFGGTLNDSITGNAGQDWLSGGGGIDTLVGGAGADNLDGGDGNDSLDGGLGSDFLDGDAGNDTINGGDNRDSIDGGDGIDTINAGSGLDIVDGGTGDDIIDGGANADSIDGGEGNDTINGGSGNDVIEGSGGNDTINGGTGADSMDGGEGNDTYTVDVVEDRVYEGVGEGVDEVATSLAAYTLGANLENLRGLGTAAFSGTGNALVNMITGTGAADTLRGAAGADTLNGLGGADRFRYHSSAESGDIIIAFDASDLFVFEGSAFGLGTFAGALAATNFVARADNNAQTVDQFFIYRTTDDTLWYDSNGSTAAGTKVMIADLSNDFALSFGDITIV